MIQQVYTETQSHPKSTAMKPHSTGSGWISKDWRWSRGQFFITTEGAQFSRSLGYPWFFWGKWSPAMAELFRLTWNILIYPDFFWESQNGPTLQVTDMLWQLWFTTDSVWHRMIGTYWEHIFATGCGSPLRKQGPVKRGTKVVEKNSQLWSPENIPNPHSKKPYPPVI